MADHSHSHSHTEAADDHDDGHDDHGGDHADDELRQAGAHEHGTATLAVALEGADVFIELDSPLYNVVGFEHAPRTDDEKAALRRAEAALAEPERLFAMNAEAGCSAADSDGVELAAHEDHGDDHDEGPDEDHADEHDEHDGEHDDEESSHRDVVVEYLFSCRSPERLTAIVVELFDVFPRFTELEAVYLDERTQRSVRLTQERHRIDLGR
ncbi:MAG: DUF2796 domain-containing protein [Pseudomonadota bacterium]